MLEVLKTKLLKLRHTVISAGRSSCGRAPARLAHKISNSRKPVRQLMLEGNSPSTPQF